MRLRMMAQQLIEFLKDPQFQERIAGTDYEKRVAAVLRRLGKVM